MLCNNSRVAKLAIALLWLVLIPINLVHAQAPKSFGPAPEFTLTNSENLEFSTAKLKGKIWIANFFFTRCNGPCPIQTANLQKLQREIGEENGLQIVSISADPKHDTPEKLKEYSKAHKIETKNWHFLTGDLDTIVGLMNEGFNLGSGSEPIYHSSRLVLVDNAGTVRGYFRGTEAPEVEKLIAATKELLK